ncbi:hypothetical protein ACFQUU_08595 [Herbaspirillum sp. GCM10030257]|uniref:hypothetical protein n=1 Tax=Herbaspirillum sp. GCM10030257 TaxID=3273393 RepID=UPI0036159191
MDEYQIFALMGRIEVEPVDKATVIQMYAEILARVVDRLTDDEMRRLLLCGAYINTHGSTERVAEQGKGTDQSSPSWRGNRDIN